MRKGESVGNRKVLSDFLKASHNSSDLVGGCCCRGSTRVKPLQVEKVRRRK